jgi:dTDP-4-amino-4,6-dideoxygalactose transaminase
MIKCGELKEFMIIDNMKTRNLRLSKSIIGQSEADAVTRILLEDGYLGMGAEVGKFESEIADYLNVDSGNVVCVSTGTSALHLAVEAVLSPGEEVLVPSFTFLSSYQSISAARAIPVSCDIYEDSLTIDLEDAKSKITEKTRAIMPVHYASNPASLDKVYELAREFNLRVIEDAAHAFGCSFRSKKIGSFGDIVCFSFDGIKNITSGEGGAIVTSDQNVLSIVKDGRLLSIEKDSDKRYKGQRSWDFDSTRQGYRYHMSNIFAAIGRVQLKRLDNEFAPKRKSLLNKYIELLNSNPDIILQIQDPEAEIVPHIFCVRVLNGKRTGLKFALEDSNIPTGIHYKPNHLLTYYGGGNIKLPITEKIYKEVLTLPLHPELEVSDVEQICKLITNYLNN